MTNERLWIPLLFAIVFVLVAYIIYKRQESIMYEEVPDDSNADLLQTIAEYRTYMVNQWLCLLAYWFGIESKDAQTKLVCPAPNQNCLYFFHENLEIQAFFNWNAEIMDVRVDIFDGDNGYTPLRQTFSISQGRLENDKLFLFIDKAKKIAYHQGELSADDVISIAKELKVLAKGFESEDAAKLHLFDSAADLMILMRNKKLRNNKKLLKFYMDFVYWLWNTHKKEFLEYLEMPEKEEEKVEGNE